MDYILEVQNLCKTYPDKKFMLNNVSFGVNKGTIVGLVGKNGAGKSTTINAILNIINKDNGVIKLFGEKIRDEKVDVRNNIAVVFDNINFYEELTPKKLEKVMGEVYKNWDREAFYQLLDRFELPCDKKIKTFSRGMAMKLSISVALSHKARLLILDEATSNVDTRTEKAIQNAMQLVMQNRTSIVIAHRLSTIRDADLIVVMDQGRIVESGDHETLLAQKGKYYELYMTQYAGFAT